MTPYDKMRAGLHTGDIAFFSGRGPLAKGIQLFTKGRLNHVGIVVRANVLGTERVFILEETPAGRQLNFMSTRADGVIAYMPTYVFDETLSDYINDTGRPYSFWNAIIAGLNLPRGWKQSKSYICSQMVAEYLYDSDFNLPDDGLVHPNKLEKILSEIFEEVVYEETLSASAV